MSQTITSPTVRFDKGQSQVILLPEESKEIGLWSYEQRILDIQRDYNEAVAYARAHPIDVDEKSKMKIYYLVRKKYIPLTMLLGEWQPTDLTEYKLEMKLEIKEMCASDICDTDGACEHCREPKQVACLIEDDKSIPIKSENLFGFKSIAEEAQDQEAHELWLEACETIASHTGSESVSKVLNRRFKIVRR